MSYAIKLPLTATGSQEGKNNCSTFHTMLK